MDEIECRTQLTVSLRELADASNLESMVEVFRDRIGSCFAADLVCVALFRLKTWDMCLADATTVRRWSVQRSENDLLGCALGGIRPMYIPNLEKASSLLGLESPEFWLSERSFESWVGLPIRSGNRLIGVLSLYAERSSAFDSERFFLIQNFSDHLALRLMLEACA